MSSKDDVTYVAGKLGVPVDGKSAKQKYEAVKAAMLTKGLKDKAISEYAGELRRAETTTVPKKAKADEKEDAAPASVVTGIAQSATTLPSTNSTTTQHRVDVAAPQITMNVPAPVVNLDAQVGPQWWHVVAEFRNAALYMIAGAAIWTVVGRKFLVVAGL